eukprot:675941-Pyramimonas_sp.AAC.1
MIESNAQTQFTMYEFPDEEMHGTITLLYGLALCLRFPTPIYLGPTAPPTCRTSWCAEVEAGSLMQDKFLKIQ